MASPPQGGLRDAAGFAISASDDKVATDTGAEHDATGQSLEAPRIDGAAAGISAGVGASADPTNRDLPIPDNQRLLVGSSAECREASEIKHRQYTPGKSGF